MAEWLGQNGYDTYLFSSNVYVEDKTNLTQGFDTKDYSYKDPWKGPARAVASKKLIQRDRSTEISPSFRPEGSRALGWGKSVFKDSAPVAQRALMDWIDEREQGVPFFAFVNLMEAHSPRTPSIESRRELLNKEQITRGLETDVSQTKLVDYTFGDTRYSPDELEAIYGVYDASVLDLDKATGNLLDALEAKGLLENTIVVLTADHGENLGEHGHFEHRFVIYEPLIHVPLLIRYPKKVSPGRVSSETSNLGIFATILELTGLEPPDTEMEKGSLLAPSEGVAFAEIAGAEPVWTKKVMKRYPSAEWAKLKRSYRSVSAQGWKYVSASDGDEELYELSSDPGELKNAAEDELEQVKVMGAQLKTRLQNIPSYDRSKRATDDSPVRAKAGSETEQQLKMLGYVE
jgi:arylsulfatase A-like enzyme